MGNISREESYNREYIVYMHVNNANGKIYIGTTSNSIERRSGANGSGYKSNKAFWEDIQKYGWCNFEHKIVCSALSRDDAFAMEVELIEKYNSNNPNFGYNISSGGQGGNTGVTASDELRLRMSKLYSGENNPMYGICGKDNPNYGRKLSEYQIQRIKETHTGKIVSKETRDKLSERKKLNGDWSGCKNPMYGKVYGDAPQSRSVRCVNTGDVYTSIKEAAESTGCFATTITRCCKGKQKTTKGYVWEYAS